MTDMNSRFSGQVAIITGGALGIGGATARRLASEGASVLLADINDEAAGANVDRIKSAGGQAEAIDDRDQDVHLAQLELDSEPGRTPDGDGAEVQKVRAQWHCGVPGTEENADPAYILARRESWRLVDAA